MLLLCVLCALCGKLVIKKLPSQISIGHRAQTVYGGFYFLIVVTGKRTKYVKHFVIVILIGYFSVYSVFSVTVLSSVLISCTNSCFAV